MKTFLLFLFFFLPICISAERFIVDRDLSHHEQGMENFQYLYELHNKARQNGGQVVYPENEDVFLIVTETSQSILLSDSTDFNGCTITVDNQDKTRSHFYLFLLMPKVQVKDIEVLPELIDKGDFSSIPELAKGLKTLCVNDANLWCERIGHDDPCYRKDILLLEDGISQNKVIAPYSNSFSAPKCQYYETTTYEKSFANLCFIRERFPSNKDRWGKTLLLKVKNINNIRISNISVTTPDDENEFSDFCFNIEDCTNLNMEDIKINGTYSQYDQYGYGISLTNVYNSTFSNIKTNTKWGVFGNYCVNTATLKDCNINRFDVHCYGKDITMKNCSFYANTDYDHDSHNVYNQFSSIYGNVSFNNCIFQKGIPLLIEPSFNAYTYFQLYFNDCVFNVGKFNYLIDVGFYDNMIHPRGDLNKKEWPVLYIKNLVVNTDNENFTIYHFNRNNNNSKRPQLPFVDVSEIKTSLPNIKIRRSNL